MIFKISREDFKRYPGTGYLVGGENAPVIFEVSDDFVRDFKLEFNSESQTNYTTILIRLIQKADVTNFNKLLKIYPNECLFIWCYKNLKDFNKQVFKN